jgi:hypothetical protein
MTAMTHAITTRRIARAEWTIMRALGKIASPVDLREWVRDSGIREVPIAFAQAAAAAAFR